MNNILVPIGNVSTAHETLQYAVDFAQTFSSTVYAMEVFSAPARSGSLTNISQKVEGISKERLKEVISMVDPKGVEIKIATYKGDLIDGLKEVDTELGLDLIIISTRCNDYQEEYYLGPTTGGIIKQTNIPTLIVPKGAVFSPYKSALTAFKSGILKDERILNPLKAIVGEFDTHVSLLMVKTPDTTEQDLEINPALKALGEKLTVTEQAKTYLGVLEHLKEEQPEILAVFRRKRGFFKALLEKNTILKSEFNSRVPVLVLSVKKD